MTEIRIPFRTDMALEVICGRKRCTTRSKRYGSVGDTFPVTWEGITYKYKLVHVEQRTLGFIASFLHDPEGFDNASEFVKIWNEIHPKKRFKPDEKKWVHWFEVSR